jgi:hypothetical protein
MEASMKGGSWIALITLGCFMTLASFAYGTTAPRPHSVRQPITAETDMEPVVESNAVHGHLERGVAVKLWKRAPTVMQDAAALTRALYIHDQKAEQIAFNDSLTDEQKQTALWGHFTRKGSMALESTNRP